jgi:2-keto-4-pentenoate hydratase/2-oxohepta-3-ene-1,7-dioic acid hydratase in catechol pathway
MKIARIALPGESPTWAVVDVDNATMQPIAGCIEDWGRSAAQGRMDFEATGAPVAFSDLRILPPITATSTIVGVGMNYWSHLEELGMKEPPFSPVGFLKPRSAIVGHGDELAYPAITAQLDFEVELVAVMAEPAHRSGGSLTDAVLGYTVGNDVSARDASAPMVGLDLFTMKALTGTAPVGPWITTKDEFGGSGQVDVEIVLRVNGEERQRDRTSNMIWSIDQCLSYVVDRMTLNAGDIVFTGTTAGVGLEDGRFLSAGDVVEAEIGGVGVLRNRVAVKSATYSTR